jgi:Cof subfamily protein (haloacid dehalogenase superfamily)
MNAVTNPRARLVLFDLDGTLLDVDRSIRPRSAESIRRLSDAGVHVGFATGRPPRSVLPYADTLDLAGPVICFNGALVWHLGDERALHARHLDKDAARLALEIARERGVHANLYLGDRICVEASTETARTSETKDGVKQDVVGPLPAHLDSQGDAPVKILFIAPPAELPGLTEALRGRVQADFELVNSEPDYLEMLPPETSKGSATRALCEVLGISTSEVLAFGDNLNDLELVQVAGCGVAMGNAHEQLKEAADVVIGGNDSDAIAEYLEGSWALEGDALVRR